MKIKRKNKEKEEFIENYKNYLINNWEMIKDYVTNRTMNIKVNKECWPEDFLPNNYFYEKKGFNEITKYNKIPIYQLLYLNGMDDMFQIDKYGAIFYLSAIKKINNSSKLILEPLDNRKKLYDDYDYNLFINYNSYNSLFMGFSEEEIKNRITDGLIIKVIDNHLEFEKYFKLNDYDLGELQTTELPRVASRLIKNNKFNDLSILEKDEINKINYYDFLKKIYNYVSNIDEQELNDIYKKSLSLFCDICLIAFIFMSKIVYLNKVNGKTRKFNYKLFDDENNEILSKTVDNISPFFIKNEIINYEYKSKLKLEGLNFEIQEIIDYKQRILDDMLEEYVNLLGMDGAVNKAKTWDNRVIHSIAHSLIYHCKDPETRYKAIDVSIELVKLNIDNFINKTIFGCSRVDYYFILEDITLIIDVLLDSNILSTHNCRNYFNIPNDYHYDNLLAFEYLKKGYKLVLRFGVNYKLMYLYGLILYKEIFTKNTKEEGLQIIKQYNEHLEHDFDVALARYWHYLKDEKNYDNEQSIQAYIDNKLEKVEKIKHDYYANCSQWKNSSSNL